MPPSRCLLVTHTEEGTEQRRRSRGPCAHFLARPPDCPRGCFSPSSLRLLFRLCQDQKVGAPLIRKHAPVPVLMVCVSFSSLLLLCIQSVTQQTLTKSTVWDVSLLWREPDRRGEGAKVTPAGCALCGSFGRWAWIQLIPPESLRKTPTPVRMAASPVAPSLLSTVHCDTQSPQTPYFVRNTGSFWFSSTLSGYLAG